MKTALIIHGAYGNSEENWFPWLKEKLVERGFLVISPNFPTPQNQNIESWFKVIKPYLKNLNSESVLIGHSVGVAFILNILEKIDKPIKSSYLVSGFLNNLSDPTFDKINKSFLKEFNWFLIRNNCKKFYVYHSDNDPYVPLKRALVISKNLKTKPIIITGAGHFNKASGYVKFQKLFNDIVK